MLPEFKFHHIGIATDSIKNTAQYYTKAGYCVTDITYDKIQNVSIAFLEKDGMPLLELIEPASFRDNSPVVKIIENLGVSPYHICYEVNNIENAINQLKEKKFLLLAHPVNAIAMNNRKICFLYNKEVGLIELVECAV